MVALVDEPHVLAAYKLGGEAAVDALNNWAEREQLSSWRPWHHPERCE